MLTLGVDGFNFAFHAGQAVWLRKAGARERRPYSMASAPTDLSDAGVLDFLIGLERDGDLGPHLSGLDRGSVVEIEGPFGGFELPVSTPESPILLVAGGTGIAPLRSMWRERLACGDPSPLTVIYSARSSLDLAFLPELERLQHAGRIDLTVTVTGSDNEWSGGRGRVTSDALERHLAAPARVRCAVCGPASFVAHVAQTLSELGVPDGHVATERW